MMHANFGGDETMHFMKIMLLILSQLVQQVLKNYGISIGTGHGIKSIAKYYLESYK